jgi:hypothetical protein
VEFSRKERPIVRIKIALLFILITGALALGGCKPGG